jgi:hypothetical protein
MPSIEEFVDADLEGGEPTHFLDETEESGRVTVVFEAGMKCEPKRLYPKYDSSRYVEWVDEIPDKVTDQAYGYGDAPGKNTHFSFAPISSRGNTGSIQLLFRALC